MPQDSGLDTSAPRPLGFARVAKGRARGSLRDPAAAEAVHGGPTGLPHALRSHPRTRTRADRDPRALSDARWPRASRFSISARTRTATSAKTSIAFVADKLGPVAGAREGRRHVLHALQHRAGRQAPGLGLPDALVRAPRRGRHPRALREEARRHAGETTKDGKVTLRTAECLASLRHRADDAGRQGVLREPHAGRGRPDPRSRPR